MAEKTSEANDRITRSKVVKGISAVDTTTTNLTDPTPAAESNNRVAPIFSEKENVAPGEPHHLSIEMGSIRKIQCANDYDYYYNGSEGE